MLQMLFVVIMLHLSIVIQAMDCSIRNYFTLNQFNPINDNSIIVGVTSACTIFAVPQWLVRFEME